MSPMVRFHPFEMPVAASMLQAANRLELPRDPTKPSFRQNRILIYSLFLYYWTAFNNIYTTISFTADRTVQLKRNRVTEEVEYYEDGSARIPKVEQGASERDQIKLAVAEFSEEFRYSLITHPNVRFFVDRSPRWQGEEIENDAIGQRLNGVLNVKYTVDRDYPVWSPIDRPAYEEFMADPSNEQARDLLTVQIVFLLYTVRNNLMHGGKRADEANDLTVVEHAVPLLQMIVEAFLRLQ